MSTKFTVAVTDFHRLHRNTLFGFATIRIAELHLEIAGVAIHQKGDKRWTALLSRPQVKDNALVREDDGKVVYSSILQFTSRAVADAFSQRVIEALIAFDPDAFAAEPERATS
jgi:hypothetical protein